MQLKAGPISLTLCAAALATAVPAAAQDQYQPPRATEYAETLNMPDLTGIWYADWTLLFALRDKADPSLTPEAQRVYDEYLASDPSQEAQARCLPPGIPRIMQLPFPIEILFSPGRVTIITEAYSQVRRIYTDGRPLPDDPEPFFNGYSVGHWEGDTLVVDTVGLSPDTDIVYGLPHTENSRVQERLYLQAPGELIDEITITNPDVLTEPFVQKFAFRSDNEFPMREYVCEQNNRLTSGEDGANIDLGFDHLEDEGVPAVPPAND